MNKIGFKNFRKFADFPVMRFAPITLFVGGNNAGKSSVVKGILALSDFLSDKRFDLDMNMDFEIRNHNSANTEKINQLKIDYLKKIKFYFNTNYLTHIGTFKRALFNQSDNANIVFKTNLGIVDVEIVIIGNQKDEEAVSGTVSEVHLFIEGYEISIDFYLLKDSVAITFHHADFYRLPQNRHEENLKNYFNSFNRDYLITTNISSNLNWRSRSSLNIIELLIESVEASLTATVYPETYENLFDRKLILSRSRSLYDFYKINPIDNIDKESLDFLKNSQRYFYNTRNSSYKLPALRWSIIQKVDIEYIYAHAVTQTVIYSAKDSNDYLSCTIHEFASVQKYKHKRDFIVKWMKEFEIGQNFTIKSVGGEAHIVHITNINGKKVNLADKGMGSIQLMVLLFRLAITLPKRKIINNSDDVSILPPDGKVFIIEEPEQNLHPNLQSKLAFLFYKLNKDYGFRFIVETHSEYLIRKSQVIVGGENYVSEEELREKNPFRVYFFNKENKHTPYIHMKYRRNGLFDRPFGEGFYDEAGNSQLQLMKIERDKKNV